MQISGAYRGEKASGERGWWLAFQYDEVANAALKRHVPGAHFDRSKQAWWIPVDHEDTVILLFPSFGAYAHQLQLL